MQDNQEIDIEGLKKEAEAFNLKQELDKLNQLVKIDQKGTLKNRKRTSTIDIPGTKANKDAKDLGFQVIPSSKATPLKK
ncbi:MAG: hypothetical protein ACD_12C00889G0007 [uncultured bacterium]|nr:MAG: hypothetical protein ACD_12C00889G0007 [uncultured bacterium]